MARRKWIEPLTEYRQSNLASMERCARRTRANLQAGDVTTGWVEDMGDLGTIFHEVVAVCLKTMWRQGYEKMPTEEAMAICREVYAASPVTLPTESRHALASLVLAWCSYPFDTSRILALERPIYMDIQCPDGEVRRLKGQPDLILRVSDDEIEIWDWKTGKGKPKSPQGSMDAPEAEGKQYLSDRGHFQLDTYGLLALAGVLEDGSPLVTGATKATLCELFLRWGGALRKASITTGAFEHIVPQLAANMMKLDRGIREGPKSEVWKERPGPHCNRQCPVALSCPVPREMRGIASIATPIQANAVARTYVVAKAQYTQAADMLKCWEEADNPPGLANDREEVRWGPSMDAYQSKGGGRKFGIWPRGNKNGETA